MCKCVICGTSYTEKDSMFFENKIHNIQINFEYGSILDGEKWSYDFCDECLIEIKQQILLRMKRKHIKKLLPERVVFK